MQLLAVLPVEAPTSMQLKLTLQPTLPVLQAMLSMPTLMALPLNPKLLLLVHPRSGVMRTCIGGTHSSFVSISMAQ
jgi:hypothetical protein